MVSKFSKKKDAVIDFVKFLLRDESQDVFYSNAGFYPVTTSFYNDSLSLQRHPEIAGIKEMMRAGVHRPAQKDYTNYSTIMAHYFVLAIRNEISVDEALESVNKAIHSGKTLVVTR
jgi:ABC-type glycerol-3-phosphate transport system substrate-binding protein